MAKGRLKTVAMPDATRGNIHIRVHNVGLSERVEIENHSQITQPLTGWVLASLRGNQFYPLPPIILPPGAVVCIHSGTDALNAPPRDWLWTTENVWRNASDVAILFDSNGQEIARHTDPSARRAGSSLRKAKVLVNENSAFRIANRG